MKVLVVGSGGREHALVWKLSSDTSCPTIFCAPGNAGTAALARNVPIAAEDIDGLMDWARENRPDLTVIGPEAPLCEGLVDRLAAEGFRAFGPTQEAARLEGSKLFAKEVMQAGHVPTAEAKRFEMARDALEYVEQKGVPIVIKADGLAAGKGVYVCTDMSEAEAAIDDILVKQIFGAAGRELIVEEYLEGEEASILALVDGESILMLASSQDHKRVFNGDRGANTGGMGAYSPAPLIDEALWPVIRSEVFERTLAELKRRGIVYKGVLYAGLMITPDGPKVLEFNCRFGDPETQAILPRIDGDLLPAMEACIDGALREDMLRWRDGSCTCVVMASGGYPGPYEKGKQILGLDEAGAIEGVVVFHAGTKNESDAVITSGGRVLGVSAVGDTLSDSLRKVYRAVSKLEFDQAQYRTDIGHRGLCKNRP